MLQFLKKWGGILISVLLGFLAVFAIARPKGKKSNLDGLAQAEEEIRNRNAEEQKEKAKTINDQIDALNKQEQEKEKPEPQGDVKDLIQQYKDS